MLSLFLCKKRMCKLRAVKDTYRRIYVFFVPFKLDVNNIMLFA